MRQRRIVGTVALAMVVCVGAGCRRSLDRQVATAADVLACARASLGAHALNDVRSLRIRQVRSPAPGAAGQLKAEEEVTAALPDRYKEVARSELPAGPTSLVTILGVSGRATFRRLLINGSSTGSDSPEWNMAAKHAFARAALVWLLRESSVVPLRWSVVDSTNATTDRAAAAVPANRRGLRANGTDGFEATMLLDRDTCHPLALLYERRATPADLRAEVASGFTVLGDTRLERLQLREYRSFRGVMFPTVIERTTENRPISETQVTAVDVNPELTDDDFRAE